MESLYTVTEVMERTGVVPETFLRHRARGYIPDPSIIVGCRKLYTAAELQLIKDHFVKPIAEIKTANGWYDIGQAAKVLGLGSSALNKRIATGTFPAPTHRQGRRLYYRLDELEANRGNLKAENNSGRSAREATAAGFFSIKRAATELNMPAITLTSWLNKEQIPRPARTFKSALMLYYNQDDLGEIRRLKRHYFVSRIKLP